MAKQDTQPNPWLLNRQTYEPQFPTQQRLTSQLRELSIYAGAGIIPKGDHRYDGVAGIVARIDADYQWGYQATQYDAVRQYFDPSTDQIPGTLVVRNKDDSKVVVVVINGTDGQFQADLAVLMKAHVRLGQRIDVRADFANDEDLFPALQRALVISVSQQIDTQKGGALVSSFERSLIGDRRTNPQEIVRASLARMRLNESFGMFFQSVFG